MADYDIFRERLAIKYPSYGHALWEPGPRNPDRPVQIGDVGFVRRGKFYRLFNILLSADDPSHAVLGVPEYHEPLVPTFLDHSDTRSLGHNNYCSPGVTMEPDPGYHSGPDDFRQVSFKYERTRGAAVLSLPVAARREDTLAQDEFKRWIVKRIDSWFAFARRLGLGIQQMEEIILVTGCDLTRSWTNIAFLGGQVDAEVSFRVRVKEPDTCINFQFLPENARGAVLRHGPEGTNLPENQCVFIRGFRVVRSFWMLPRRLEAAAGPSPHLGGYDCDPDTEVISIPANTRYRDPLHLLLDYIAEKATDCDMVLVHDNDLGTIDGLGRDSSIETLEPDMMADLLRRSDMKINKARFNLSLTDRDPNTDTAVTVVKVAMLSMTSQNRNIQIEPQSQRSPLAAQNVEPSSGSIRQIPPNLRGVHISDRNASGWHHRHQSQNHQINSAAGSYAGGPPVQVGTSNSYSQPNQQPVNTPHDRRPQGYTNNTPVAPTLQRSYSSQGSPSGREWNAGHQPSHVRPESGNAVSLHNVQEQQHHYVHGTQVQPPAATMVGASGFSRPSNNICRIPDCSQLGFFNPHNQEQLDYCQAHLVTALGGYAAACKGCGRFPVLENSDYCSRFCAGGGRSAAIVPQGFAPACQECRRAITENMQIYGGHFCSPECWNAYLRTHSSRR